MKPVIDVLLFGINSSKSDFIQRHMTKDFIDQYAPEVDDNFLTFSTSDNNKVKFRIFDYTGGNEFTQHVSCLHASPHCAVVMNSDHELWFVREHGLDICLQALTLKDSWDSIGDIYIPSVKAKSLQSFHIETQETLPSQENACTHDQLSNVGYKDANFIGSNFKGVVPIVVRGNTCGQLAINPFLHVAQKVAESNDLQFVLNTCPKSQLKRCASPLYSNEGKRIRYTVE